MRTITSLKLYLAHMGQYPVIFLTVKSMKQGNLDNAFYCFKEKIVREYKRHDKALDSLEYESEKERYLRISKESIFTGLNHLDIIFILHPQYAEHFGFTQKEHMDKKDLTSLYQAAIDGDVKTIEDSSVFGIKGIAGCHCVTNKLKFHMKNVELLSLTV